MALTTSPNGPVFPGCPTSLTSLLFVLFFPSGFNISPCWCFPSWSLELLTVLRVLTLFLRNKLLHWSLPLTSASLATCWLFSSCKGTSLQLHQSNPSCSQHLTPRCCDEGPRSLLSTISSLLHQHFTTLPLPACLAPRVSVPLLIVETPHAQKPPIYVFLHLLPLVFNLWKPLHFLHFLLGWTYSPLFWGLPLRPQQQPQQRTPHPALFASLLPCFHFRPLNLFRGHICKL